MAESTRSSKLQTANDKGLKKLLTDLVKKHHSTLSGASISVLFALDQPLTKWGKAKVISEETWLLAQGEVDVVLHVNKTLWERLTEPGRRGLLDHLLSLVQAKEGGGTEMETERGTRTLYEADRPSLSIHAMVLARNPEFVGEIDELARMKHAIDDPQGFLLFVAQEEEAAGEEEDETTAEAI